MSDTKALVFNIVRSSFVDGYGIRTTIFLKGCPLRCVWCCNPEGQSMDPELKVTYGNCDGCGLCVPRCNESALSIIDGLVSVDRKKCTGCGQCVDACFKDALGMFGTWYTADEIFEIVKKESDYYRTTGGGLTIGGGEATLWPDFVLELIDLCHQNYIHTAIDTCGYTTTEKGLECLKKADLLLFDIKGLDTAAHRENTGVDNDVIQKNLRLLSDLRKPMIIRLPIITHYNDSDDELEKEAELISGLKSVERVDLIPVHEYSMVKYQQMDREYLLSSEPVSDERQEKLLQLFKSYGLNAQIGG